MRLIFCRCHLRSLGSVQVVSFAFGLDCAVVVPGFGANKIAGVSWRIGEIARFSASCVFVVSVVKLKRIFATFISCVCVKGPICCNICC